jgi:hypothetical protein
VCSGCSGDYAGGFEDCDETTQVSGGNQPAGYEGRPKGNGNPLVTRDFEPPSYRRSDLRLGNSPTLDGKSGEGIYEVLVSATRIVEIRIIPANSEEFPGLSKGRAAEKLAADKHSEAASAKYYQTSAGIAVAAGDRAEVPIWRGFAGLVAGEFGKWIRGMRNALGKPRSRKFHRL